MQPRDLDDGEFEIGLDCCEIDLLRIGPRWSQFRTQIAADSPLEQAGFELPVPPQLALPRAAEKRSRLGLRVGPGSNMG